ncbi:MAG: ABC transporter permease, partial [Pseudomonadota bacterium]
MSKSSDPSLSPSFEYFGGAHPRLMLRGAWVVTSLGALDGKLRELADAHGSDALAELDLTDLKRIDTAGAYLADRALRSFAPSSPEIIGAEPEALDLLHQARGLATQEEHAPPVHEEGHGFVDLLERTGRGAEHLWHELLETLSFLGGTLVALSAAILRPAKMRWTALV